MADGDANSRYFHLSTIIRRRFNAIEYIRNVDGSLEHNRESIGHIFLHYFSSLFTSIHPVYPFNLNGLITPSISTAENSFLCSIPDFAEVKGALFSMGSHKSPGPDGFNPLFFKLYWNTVQDSVVAGVQHFFKHG